MSGAGQSNNPDLKTGIPDQALANGEMLVGHVGEEQVLLARRGDEVFAIGATCTHYGGPLGKGLMVDDTVRCPWHHACFSLRTGEAIAAPALTATSCWRVDRRDGQIFISGRTPKTQGERAKRQPRARTAKGMVIIGGGAAGYAAADMLRREGYGGQVTIISADDAPPYDRPNLSKDYLAGTAPEDWIPLRPKEFYAEADIDLRLGTTATAMTLRRVASFSTTAKQSASTSCCSQPGLSRSACNCLAPNCRTSEPCAR